MFTRKQTFKVFQMAEVSSMHIPQHTAEALGQPDTDLAKAELACELNYTRWSDFGWIIYCDAVSALRVQSAHPELSTFIAQCAQQDIPFLKLDCDAAVQLGLPTFDW